MRLPLPPPMYRPWILLLLACPLTVLGQMASLSPESEALASQTLSRPSQEQKQDLKKVLEEVSTQYQVNFIFDNRLVDQKMTTLPRKSDPLEVALQQLLTPLDLSFKKLDEQHYVIKKSEHKNATVEKVQSSRYHEPSVTASLDLVPMQMQMFSKSNLLKIEKTITGRVTDLSTNEGLPGVNILVKGTTIGTITDVEGNYRLTVPDDAETLVFSSVGYISEEILIGNQTTINLEMAPDIQSLSEVVVVGYGTQSRKEITSAVSSVRSEDIQNVPVTGVDALLQGRAAGVQVVQNSGTPGAENYVRIRGNGSLLGQNRPLYIVDGVQMNNITTNVLDAGGQLTTSTNDINPNDIESIEILKDAAATAIYGARASNGVVLITTKRGSEGKAKFDLDVYTGTQQVWRQLDLLNGPQYVDLRTEAINNSNALLGQNAPIPEFLSGTGANTDWQDQIFRRAPITDANLSMSGGGDKTTFFISLGHFNQQGTIINQGFKRTNARINIDHQATDRLKVGNSLTLSYSRNDRVFTGFNSNNPIAAALVYNPNFPVYNEDDSYFQDPNGEIPNPVQIAEEITFFSKQKRVLGNVFAEYKILDGLTFKTSLGIDYLDDQQQRFIPNTIIGFQNGAEATAANFEQLLWSIENTLTYSKQFGSQHSLTALLGYSVLEREETLLRAGGTLAGSNIITTVAISNPRAPDNYITNYGLVSYFGRANYNYDDRYLASATLRADGSSRFGANNRFGYFPSASLGWRISGESFMENIPFISDLKLRASYGIVGNQEGLSGDFPSLATYGTGNDYLSNFPGIAQQSIPNADLTWEESTQINLGLDATFFDNRVNVIADVYQKNTDKLLFFRQLPWSSGFSQDNGSNIGRMENKGIELALTTLNVVGDFNWTTSFNISFNRNEITSLPDYDPENPLGSDFSQQQPSGLGTDGTRTVFRVGEPFGSFYGYKVLGVDPQTGYIIYENLDGSTNDDGEPTLGISDRQIFGNALPLHTGGLTNEFSYKGFTLSVFMQWSYGNDVYNQTAAVLENMTGFFNQNTDVLRRWQQPGDQTDIPIALFSDATGLAAVGANNREISDRFLEDGSFLRVKDIRLGYSFDSEFAERLFLRNLNIYGSVRNAFTFTDYSGFDPESQNNSVVTAVGVDYLEQPQPRTFIIGINVGF